MSSFPKNIGISVLTGFLGSGKTTILTSLIKQKQMANAAIIINEFGEVGLDHDLIETTDENVIELQNGCICCTIQGDLKTTLLNLLKKMEKGDISPFNHVIIETTGLADPVPIIHTLMTSLDLQRIYSIDGVITVVDAINGDSTYNAHEEAVKQTAFADRIILSKTDIADKEKVKAEIKSKAEKNLEISQKTNLGFGNSTKIVQSIGYLFDEDWIAITSDYDKDVQTFQNQQTEAYANLHKGYNSLTPPIEPSRTGLILDVGSTVYEGYQADKKQGDAKP